MYVYPKADPEPAKSDEICATTAVDLFKPLNLFGTSYYCHLLQYLSSLFLCCIFQQSSTAAQQHSCTKHLWRYLHNSRTFRQPFRGKAERTNGLHDIQGKCDGSSNALQIRQPSVHSDNSSPKVYLRQWLGTRYHLYIPHSCPSGKTNIPGLDQGWAKRLIMSHHSRGMSRTCLSQATIFQTKRATTSIAGSWTSQIRNCQANVGMRSSSNPWTRSSPILTLSQKLAIPFHLIHLFFSCV